MRVHTLMRPLAEPAISFESSALKLTEVRFCGELSPEGVRFCEGWKLRVDGSRIQTYTVEFVLLAAIFDPSLEIRDEK